MTFKTQLSYIIPVDSESFSSLFDEKNESELEQFHQQIFGKNKIEILRKKKTDKIFIVLHTLSSVSIDKEQKIQDGDSLIFEQEIGTRDLLKIANFKKKNVNDLLQRFSLSGLKITGKPSWRFLCSDD